MSGGHTDKTFAALGPLGSKDKISHAAMPGNLLSTHAFSADLGIQIELQRLIDGDHVIKLADHSGIIDVTDRVSSQPAVFMHPVIKPLGAHGKCIDGFIHIDVFLAAISLTRIDHIHIGIDKHFRMDAQIFEVGIFNY